MLDREETLYDQDLLAWTEQQAAQLRAGRFDQLDVGHLIEELEAMAGKLRRELKDRSRILLAHLLKSQYQPRRRSRSWAATIAEQRDQISDLLEESPQSSARDRVHRTCRLAAGAQAGDDRDRPAARDLPRRSAL